MKLPPNVLKVGVYFTCQIKYILCVKKVLGVKLQKKGQKGVKKGSKRGYF